MARADKLTGQIWSDIEKQQKNNTQKADFQIFTGTYSDKWFGEIVVSVKKRKTLVRCKAISIFTGELFPYKGNTYIAKWNDRSMDADAYVNFELDSTGNASGITMKAISPLTDFSFDFQDLDLKNSKIARLLDKIIRIYTICFCCLL